MGSWFTSAAIKAVLEWLWSLWVRFKKEMELRQEGRKQVEDAIDKERQEADKEMEATSDPTPTDLNGAVERMRERSRTSGDY
jgi:hypothetical protein